MSTIADRFLREFSGTTTLGTSAAVTLELDHVPSIAGGSLVIDVLGSEPLTIELDDIAELGQLLLALDEHVRALGARLHEEEHRREQAPAHGAPGLRLVPASGS